MSGGKILYSLDEETFSHSDTGSLFDEMECEGRLNVGEVYYEQTFKQISFSDIFHEGRFFEDIDETFNDLLGWEDYEMLPVKEGGEEALKVLLNEWAEKYISFGENYMTSVGEVRELKVTEDDVN